MNIIGNKYGRLLVVEQIGVNKHKAKTYKCVCDCGTVKTIVHSSLVYGSTKSCGCLSRDFNKTKVTNGLCREDSQNGKRYRSLFMATKKTKSVTDMANWILKNPCPDGRALVSKNPLLPLTPETAVYLTIQEAYNHKQLALVWTLYGVQYNSALEAAIAIGVSRTQVCRIVKQNRVGCYVERKFK